MGDARSQAAAGMSAEDIEKALDVLRLIHRDEFTFGHDPEYGFWVIKNGDLASLLTDDSPEGLGRRVVDVYGAQPS